ncbi:glyoxalase [Nostoc minutum NIES-26]|uniref:Glyoxalase n=1 Tax=Nostoc minutum NIES-26 TaxID=1844469 RepID=A0A367QRI1_9NOSO|nr:VOC family protein [Dendronalium sp. ChiSLP03b]MDZ8208756.1 VOC family protein [Dendronalium sp. ChiSLP03b]RCJ26806.1 glyoxalase [Nostoc minutum NIES-26]
MQIIKVLTRVYLNPVDLDDAIAFYENLFTEKCWLWFQYSEMELELAGVGSILLIAGSAEVLSPFKSTQATFLVDSLNDFREALASQGAVILAEPNKVSTGANMRAMHPDGTIIEYIEFA